MYTYMLVFEQYYNKYFGYRQWNCTLTGEHVHVPSIFGLLLFVDGLGPLFLVAGADFLSG